MPKPQSLPADIVMERLRSDVPIVLVRRLKRLSYSLLRVAEDPSELMQVRLKAVQAVDITVSRLMDVLGQPTRPKPAQLGGGRRRKGSGAFDMDQVIDAQPGPGTGLEVVPAMPKGTPKVTGETIPVENTPGMEQF